MSRASLAALAFASVAMASMAYAQSPSPIIYPAKGQAAPQMDRDKYECHDWSRSQSGYDPTQPAQAQAPAAQQKVTGPSTSTLVRGAAGGAAVAELTDHDAGRGAAAGLLGAGAVSRMREQQAMQARHQQAAMQQSSAASQARSAYQRGFAACMEARGYVVK